MDEWMNEFFQVEKTGAIPNKILLGINTHQ